VGTGVVAAFFAGLPRRGAGASRAAMARLSLSRSATSNASMWSMGISRDGSTGRGAVSDELTSRCVRPRRVSPGKRGRLGGTPVLHRRSTRLAPAECTWVHYREALFSTAKILGRGDGCTLASVLAGSRSFHNALRPSLPLRRTALDFD
jgi:hypothetical protein